MTKVRERKERLTVTVDPAVVAAGQDAVAAGMAESMSAWVNLAMAERAAKDRRLAAMAEAVAQYEAEIGEISLTELTEQARADRRESLVVREKPRATTRRKRGAA